MEGKPLTPCWVDTALIPYTRENMNSKCAYKVVEHLMKEEGTRALRKRIPPPRHMVDESYRTIIIVTSTETN